MNLKKNRLTRLVAGIFICFTVFFFYKIRPIALPKQLILPSVPQKYKNIEIPQSMSNQSFKIKRTVFNKNAIKFTKAILKNELYVNSRWPAYKFDKKLTWKEDPFHSKSWINYFHNLDIVGYLADTYKTDPNPLYLEKAKWIIQSWWDTNPSPFYQVSRFAWFDMVAANRVINILNFEQAYQNIDDPAFKKTIHKILEKHGNFLEKDFFYSFKGNHGIFQDQALISLAILHPEYKKSKQWLNKAFNRLLFHIESHITPSGVHKEHSPSYHVIVLKVLESIDELLKSRDIEQNELKDIIDKMQTHLAYVLKPDRIFPNVGDSEPTAQTAYFIDRTFSNPYLLYIKSEGKKGMPLESFKVFNDAGVVFLHKQINQKKLYAMFMAGFHSTVHKHADDLSFILTLGKTDFLVDSGKYNYEENDPWRDYFLSTKAHNTITVDDQNYVINKSNVKKSRIDHTGSFETYNYIIGSHDLYPGVHIQRTFLYINTGSILILDKMTSEKQHTYSQLFQIGKNIEITTNQNTFNLNSPKEKKSIELIQLSNTENKMIKGQKKPIQGWLSTRWMKKEPITTLQFNTKSSASEFNTILNLNPNTSINKFEVVEENNQRIFTVEYKNGNRANFVTLK